MRYSILHDDDSEDASRDFTVSEDTGAVRVTRTLDFERRSLYKLRILAEDCPDAPNQTRTDIAEVIITISDVNDVAPR